MEAVITRSPVALFDRAKARVADFNYTPDFTAGAIGRVFEKARFLAPALRLPASQRVSQSTPGQADGQRRARGRSGVPSATGRNRAVEGHPDPASRKRWNRPRRNQSPSLWVAEGRPRPTRRRQDSRGRRSPCRPTHLAPARVERPPAVPPGRGWPARRRRPRRPWFPKAPGKRQRRLRSARPGMPPRPSTQRSSGEAVAWPRPLARLITNPGVTDSCIVPRPNVRTNYNSGFTARARAESNCKHGPPLGLLGGVGGS